MNKTDDILERLRGQQPMIDDPDALTDRIMGSLPDLEPAQQDAEPDHQEDEGKARIRLCGHSTASRLAGAK